MLLRDIKELTLEKAYEINNTFGFAFIVRDGKIKGIQVENKK
ncbi:hypothetical protein [Clostridium sp.]